MSMTTSYRCIPGFFKQEEPGTDVRFDYVCRGLPICPSPPIDIVQAQNDFGLISRAYETDKPDDTSSTQWGRFETYIHHLRATAPENTTYKLIWLSRHGQGTHNVRRVRRHRPASFSYNHPDRHSSHSSKKPNAAARPGTITTAGCLSS